MPETVGTKINYADPNAKVHSATRNNFPESVTNDREMLGGIGIRKQSKERMLEREELLTVSRMRDVDHRGG